MSPENAKFVTDIFTLFCLVLSLLVFQNKIQLRNKPYYFEKHKKIFTLLGIIGLIYPVYGIAAYIFGWNQLE